MFLELDILYTILAIIPNKIIIPFPPPSVEGCYSYCKLQPLMQSALYRTYNTKFFNPSGSTKQTVPLLHIQEIEDNIKKVHDLKKKHLKSQSQKPPVRNWSMEEEKEVMVELSAEQKIEMYKKSQYEEKMNRKKKVNQTERRARFTIIPTPMKQYLKRMSHYSLTEKESYLDQIRESEKELHFVKCNPTRKRRVASSGPSSYFHRSRILSLKDGLPINLGNLYPTLEQKIDELKPPPPVPKPSLLESVEKTIETFFYEPSGKNGLGEQMNYLQNQKLKEQKLINKAKGNINRSVDTTEKLLNTVAGFYSMKKDQKTDYEGLISTWKVDRPKTHQIRSRNYDIGMITRNKKRNLLQKFRQTSQNIRRNDIQKSKQFYNELLDFVLNKTKLMESVPATKWVCDSIREELELNLKLSTEFLLDLLIRVEQSGKTDELISHVIKMTKEYIQSNL